MAIAIHCFTRKCIVLKQLERSTAASSTFLLRNLTFQDAYFKDFTAAWVKLQENGVPELRDSL